MTQVCNRCYMVVQRACQSDTEAQDCPKLKRHREIAGKVITRPVLLKGLPRSAKR